jgi:hypothetical protein
MEGIFMKIGALPNHFLRLYIFLLPLLLLISVTFLSPPVYAESGSGRDKTIKAAARVTRHIEKMREKTKMQKPRTALGVRQLTDIEVSQIEQKLENGTMRPKEACSHCHTNGRDNKPKRR